MKVALINHYPPESGAGRYAYGLYSALRKEKGDYDMICMNPMEKEDIYKEVNKEVMFLNKFSYLRHPSLAKVLLYFINPFRIPKLYDIYHMTTQMISGYARFNRPSVVTVHDIYPFKEKEEGLSFIYNIFAKRCVTFIKYADKIIAVSYYTKKDIMNTFGISPNSIKVIHYGLDHQIFKTRDKVFCRKRLGLPLDKRIILHVGSEIPRKNVPAILEAFSKLLRDISDIVLVRVGEKKKNTEDVIRKLGLEENILYFTGVSYNNVSYFYNAADLFIFPSIKEGFGYPPLEAMACGCPVIASNTTSIPEIVGDAGILMDPFDADALALSMKKVLKDKDLSNKLSDKGIRRAAEFSWEKCAQETIKVYEEVKIERQKRR